MTKEKMDELKELFFRAVKMEIPNFLVGELTDPEMMATEKAIQKVYLAGLKNSQKIDVKIDPSIKLHNELMQIVEKSKDIAEQIHALDDCELHLTVIATTPKENDPISRQGFIASSGNTVDVAEGVVNMLREDRCLQSMVVNKLLNNH